MEKFLQVVGMLVKFIIKYKDGNNLEDCVSKRGLIRLANKQGIRISDTKELAIGKYKQIWEEFAIHLAFAVSIIILTFDVEVIDIGGQISKSHKLFDFFY